jgi:uncharacterized RDD family membrane protein YckC
VVDSLAVHVLFLTGSAMVVLLAALVGRNPPHALAEAVAVAGWTLVVGVYFVSFWTAAGQTPGMRLMRLRLTDAAGATPRLGRSVLRLVGSVAATAFVLVGFLPVLVDDRRRALQDFIASTLVIYDHPAPTAVAETVLMRSRDAPAG